MKSRDSVFIRNELVFFLILTYILSWLFVPFAGGGILPYGPSIAAVIVIVKTSGKAGLQEFWRRITNFKAGWYYLIGPAIMAACLGIPFIICLVTGAKASVPQGLPSVPLLFQLLLIGGLWEEPGWTGYTLPKLEQHFAGRRDTFLMATLTAGVFRSIWHIPLLLYGTLPWYDVFIFIFAFQFLISWLYKMSNGSVPAVMLFHFSSNLLAGGLMLHVFPDPYRTPYYILFVASACVAAALAWWTRRHDTRFYGFDK